MPLVVQMHGEPGSGKSTLAHGIAPRIGAVVLDKDVIKSTLMREGIEDPPAGGISYAVYFGMAADLVARGHAVVLDSPVYWPGVEERWLAVSRAAGSPVRLIECVCSDRDELVRRLATRSRLESQPVTLLGPRAAGAFETTIKPRLTVDTTRPLDALGEEAVAYVQAEVPA